MQAGKVSFSASIAARLRRLDGLGVQFQFRHRWLGWDERGDALFDTPEGPVSLRRLGTRLIWRQVRQGRNSATAGSRGKTEDRD